MFSVVPYVVLSRRIAEVFCELDVVRVATTITSITLFFTCHLRCVCNVLYSVSHVTRFVVLHLYFRSVFYRFTLVPFEVYFY